MPSKKVMQKNLSSERNTVSDLEQGSSPDVRCQREYYRLCFILYECVCHRYRICTADSRYGVHCEEQDKVVPVNVPSVLVPRLNWKISSASGDVIPSREFPGFKCDLGGGFNYGGAFLFLKPPAGKNVPEKRIENGETILYFDGSSYLHFPVETFPRGSFKLAFEVRPDGENSPELYTLFRHFDDILGSVTCFVRYDRLQFAFAGRDLKTDLFMTGLELPPGKWSKVCISYDLQQLKISVNGQEIRYLLDKKLALYFKSAIFGGHTKAEFGLPAGAGYFRGSLKSLSISHNTY